MRQSLLRTLSPLWICALIAGCGGSTPVAEEPAAEKEAAAEPPAAEEPSKAEEESEEKSADAEDADDGKMKDAEGKPLRTAKTILTAPEVVFMFSFANSEPKEKAQEQCEKKSDDPKKVADCMSKAQKGFDDGVRFKEEDGKWWWITLKRQGEKLISLHKVEVEFADDSEKKVTLKTKGKDKGKKPWANPPREVVVEVPNESELVLDDPKHGRLVYQAKIGITSD